MHYYPIMKDKNANKITEMYDEIFQCKKNKKNILVIFYHIMHPGSWFDV